MIRMFTASSLFVFLAACDWSLGLGGGGGGDITRYADNSADTFQATMTGPGVTGDIATLQLISGDTQAGNVFVEVSNDFQTAWITIDGTRRRLEANPSFPASATGGVYTDNRGRSLTFGTLDPNAYSSLLTYVDGLSGTTGAGVIGAETRPRNLPETTVSYAGEYQYSAGAAAPSASGAGFTDIDVDFGTGDVTGVLTATPGGAETGQMVGQVEENGFTGALALNDGDVSGIVTLDGTFYGPAAEELGGVFSGAATSGTHGGLDIIGTFTGR